MREQVGTGLLRASQKGGSMPRIDRRKPNRCGAAEYHAEMLKRDPKYRERRKRLERQIRAWERAYGREGLRSGVAVIPVVVHVVWHTAAENIPMARVNEQIARLNADFRRANTDVSTVPAAFSGVVADARIEFRLARRDPNCNATDGVTRTETEKTSFTWAADDVKSAATGGVDAWPRDRYLNIWVANITDALGYSPYPGAAAAQDGVVIAYGAFGNTSGSYDLGRTATHEVGHWLNLIHIWGPAGAGSADCSDSDSIGDTPNQDGANFGEPSFPQVSCSNGPDGDMFMNYMDYVDDSAMVMFSADQATRMNAALNTSRASLLGSPALTPPPTGGASPDLWMADKPLDVGDEPNALPVAMWESDDIWVRRQNDGTTNQEHQDPLHRPAGGADNVVYVRVRNRGCTGNASGTLRLYWAKASTGLSWPSPWDGSVTSPALMGAEIGSQAVTVAGGQSQIVAFPWAPPDPEDYASFGADATHFCLLARIETAAAAPFGMTFPETNDLYANVRDNNNIVWKNITVVDGDVGGRMAAVLVNMPDEKSSGETRLVFEAPELRGRKPARLRDMDSAFDTEQVYVDLGAELMERWHEAGQQGEGVEQVGDTTIRVTHAGAWIGDLRLRHGEYFTLTVLFEPKEKKRLPGTRIAALDVLHLLLEGGEQRIVGGQRFVVKRMARQRRVKDLDLKFGWDGVEGRPAKRLAVSDRVLERDRVPH